MIVKELVAKLGLNVDWASFEIGKEALGGLGKVAGVIAGAAVAASAGLAALVSSVAEHGREIARNAEKVGLSTDRYQEFGYAAQRSGMDVEQTNKVLGKFSTELVKAARDGGNTALVLDKLGVHWRNLGTGNRDIASVIQDVADKYAALPEGIKKAAIAGELFGERERDVTVLLNKGGQGIRDLMQEYEDLGGVMSAQTIAKSKELGAVTSKLGVIMEGIKNETIGPLIGYFVDGGEATVKWVRANRTLINSRIEKFLKVVLTVTDALVWTFKTLAGVIEWLIEHWKVLTILAMTPFNILLAQMIPNLITLAETMTAAGSAGLVAGIKTAWGWTVANASLLGIFLIFVGLALVAEDFYQFVTGGKSVTEILGQKWNDFMLKFSEEKNTDPWWLRKLKEALAIIMDITDPQLDKKVRHLLGLDDLTTPDGPKDETPEEKADRLQKNYDKLGFFEQQLDGFISTFTGKGLDTDLAHAQLDAYAAQAQDARHVFDNPSMILGDPNTHLQTDQRSQDLDSFAGLGSVTIQNLNVTAATGSPEDTATAVVDKFHEMHRTKMREAYEAVNR